MSQDDVENYFSLQRARISSVQPTVLQFFESAARIDTNFLLTSEFSDLHESIGSYDPVSTPNVVKIPLLWRNNSRRCPSEPDTPLYSTGYPNVKTLLPLTVVYNIFDKAQKLQLLRHAKQTLEYIDLSTSSTIQANQMIVSA